MLKVIFFPFCFYSCLLLYLQCFLASSLLIVYSGHCCKRAWCSDNGWLSLLPFYPEFIFNGQLIMGSKPKESHSAKTKKGKREFVGRCGCTGGWGQILSIRKALPHQHFRNCIHFWHHFPIGSSLQHVFSPTNPCNFVPPSSPFGNMGPNWLNEMVPEISPMKFHFET